MNEMPWEQRARSYDLFLGVEKVTLKRCHLNHFLKYEWESSRRWYSNMADVHVLIFTPNPTPLGWKFSFTEALEEAVVSYFWVVLGSPLES